MASTSKDGEIIDILQSFPLGNISDDLSGVYNDYFSTRLDGNSSDFSSSDEEEETDGDILDASLVVINLATIPIITVSEFKQSLIECYPTNL